MCQNQVLIEKKMFLKFHIFVSVWSVCVCVCLYQVCVLSDSISWTNVCFFCFAASSSISASHTRLSTCSNSSILRSISSRLHTWRFQTTNKHLTRTKTQWFVVFLFVFLPLMNLHVYFFPFRLHSLKFRSCILEPFT